MSDRRTDTHDRWDGDAAAYALHALQEDEVRAFEQHLAGCKRCQDELASFQKAVADLPAAAPVVTPTPELKQRVMAGVAAESQVRTDSPQDSTVPGTVAGLTARRSDWLSPRRRPRIAVGLATVAAALIAVALLTIGGGGSTRTYAGVVRAAGASASVVRSGDTGQLRFSRMPAPPPGRIYQVWLQHPGGAPEPTRTLFAARTGSVAVKGSLRGVQSVLVTAEPRPNGSPAPTRAPIIVVRLA